MSRMGIAVLALVVGVASLAPPALAEKINCANEFRSGKLYFTTAMKEGELYLYYKAVDRFALAVETCPEKAEYRARYGMALAQLASVKLEEERLTLPTPEEKKALVDSVLILYAMAGSEFDNSMAADDSKSNLKFVRENREHYWVDRYNDGIKRLQDEEYDEAVLEFQLALHVDPQSTLEDKGGILRNSKAYSQGAIAYINKNDKTEAARWVQRGLEKDPEDKKLNELLETIYVDVGRELTEQATKDKDVEKAVEGAGYLRQVQDRRGGEDPDVWFDLGLAYLAGAAIAEAEQRMELGRQAAECFGKAAEMVPPDNEQNIEFHKAALFNQAQGHMDSGDFRSAIGACTDYIAVDCDDPAIWLMVAQAYSSQDEQNQAVVALMASKSIQGGGITLLDAKANAQGDEKTSGTELGDPSFVFGYQDSEQNQVNTWIWCEKKTIRNFILGQKVGELTWD